MRVGHNAKTAAEAGLQPWLHGGGGGGEAACARLSIRKSSIGPRAGRPKGVQSACDDVRTTKCILQSESTTRRASVLPRRSMLRKRETRKNTPTETKTIPQPGDEQ